MIECVGKVGSRLGHKRVSDPYKPVEDAEIFMGVNKVITYMGE